MDDAPTDEAAVMGLPETGWFLGALARREGGPEMIAGSPVANIAIQGGDPISDKEADELKAALDLISVQLHPTGLTLVGTNFRRFIDSVLAVGRRYDGVNDPSAQARASHQDLVVLLFNWLHSARAFVEHAQVRLRRRHGHNSDEAGRFAAATSHEFDTSFAYRFFYKLRNATHAAFPGLSFSVQETAGPPGSRVRGLEVSLLFERDALLTGWTDWGAIVRGDLETGPAQFDVLDLMTDAMDSLARLQVAADKIDRPDLVAAVATVQAARQRGRAFGETPFLGRFRDRSAADMIPLPNVSIREAS